MIDLQSEPLLTMGQASKLVPGRGGKRRSAVTLWRWAKFGVRGLKMESMRTPCGTYWTSALAVQRFLTRLAEMVEQDGIEYRKRA